MVTVEELRSIYSFDIPTSQEAKYSELIRIADDACRTYAEIEDGSVTEWFDGGSDILPLTHTPIREVDAVTISGSETSFIYKARSKSIQLSFEPPVLRNSVEVTYTCGWSEEPRLFKAAVALTVQHLSKLTASRLAGVISRSTEGGTEQYDQEIIPTAAKAQLNYFRSNKVL